jgi:hypothetical protein
MIWLSLKAYSDTYAEGPREVLPYVLERPSALYGIHTSSGRSHTGCITMVGEQKIITRASNEAELVALSYSTEQGIHTTNFLINQGYTMGRLLFFSTTLAV